MKLKSKIFLTTSALTITLISVLGISLKNNVFAQINKNKQTTLDNLQNDLNKITKNENLNDLNKIIKNENLNDFGLNIMTTADGKKTTDTILPHCKFSIEDQKDIYFFTMPIQENSKRSILKDHANEKVSIQIVDENNNEIKKIDVSKREIYVNGSQPYVSTDLASKIFVDELKDGVYTFKIFSNNTFIGEFRNVKIKLETLKRTQKNICPIVQKTKNSIDRMSIKNDKGDYTNDLIRFNIDNDNKLNVTITPKDELSIESFFKDRTSVLENYKDIMVTFLDLNNQPIVEEKLSESYEKEKNLSDTVIGQHKVFKFSFDISKIPINNVCKMIFKNNEGKEIGYFEGQILDLLKNEHN